MAKKGIIWASVGNSQACPILADGCAKKKYF
jgi:hypothetical protein